MDQITEKSDLKEIRERILEIEKGRDDILKKLEHISRAVEDIHRLVKSMTEKGHH